MIRIVSGVRTRALFRSFGCIVGGIVCLSAAACERAIEIPELEPSAERVVEAWEPEVVWTRGGAREDTVLYGPWLVRGAAGEQVVVLDAGGHRIRSFDSGTGELRWSAGRYGDGPGEFRQPVDVVPLKSGDVVVWDTGLGRLTWLGSGGDLRDTRSIEGADLASRFCETADGSLLAASQHMTTSLAVLDERTMRPLEAHPLDGLIQLNPIQRQVRFATAPGGRCVYFLTQSLGFAEVSVDGFGPMHPYAETLRPPGAQVQRTEDRESARLSGRQFAARSGFTRAGESGGEVWFGFQGNTSLRGRLIDVFDIESGAYLRSYELPWGFDAIGATGERVLFLRTVGGYPVLMATRAPWASTRPVDTPPDPQ